jgi:hypothetical protein
MPGRSTLTATCAAVGRDRAVDLRDRGGADRLGIEARRRSCSSGFERLLDRRLDLLERRGRQAVLQPLEVARASSPTRSGRVASAWPSLIAAGPIS